jgi:hypothetical protein
MRFSLRSLLVLTALAAAYFAGLATARAWFRVDLRSLGHSTARAHNEARQWWVVAEQLYQTYEPQKAPWPPIPAPRAP